jgi:hypothetical protein
MNPVKKKNSSHTPSTATDLIAIHLQSIFLSIQYFP